MKNKRTPFSFFLTKGTDLSLNEGLTTETRVVEGVTGVPGNALLSRAGLPPQPLEMTVPQYKCLTPQIDLS